MLLVMGLHPTAHDLMSAEITGKARVSMAIHALALAVAPAVFLGLFGASRRLGQPDLATAALVAWGVGVVGVPRGVEAVFDLADQVFVGLAHGAMAPVPRIDLTRPRSLSERRRR